MRPRCSLSLLSIGLLAGWLTAGVRTTPAAAAGVHAHGTVISVAVGTGGGGGSPRPRVPIYDDCHDVALLAHYLQPVVGAFDPTPAETATDAPLAWRECRRIADGVRVGWIVGLPGSSAAASAGDVAGAGQAELRQPLPAVRTSPPRGGSGSRSTPPAP